MPRKARKKTTAFRKTTLAKKRIKFNAKMERVMREFKYGALRTNSGKKVTSRKQAIAIALSEARKFSGLK